MINWIRNILAQRRPGKPGGNADRPSLHYGGSPLRPLHARYDAAQTTDENGRTFEGPLFVARRTVLGEISFVDSGADQNTSARSPPANAATTLASDTAGEDAVQRMRQEVAAESQRIAEVRRICAGRHPDIEAKAIGEGWIAITGITTALGNIEANAQQLEDHEQRVRSVEENLTQISTDVQWIRTQMEDR